MVIANVKQLADEAGITLQFSGKRPNSRLALIISELARLKGKFSEFHALVLEKYWKEGKDIGDLSLLLELASSVGLDKNELLDYIKSDEPFNKLRKTTLELERYGINGVPTFIIGDMFVVGAQSHEVFEKVINQVADYTDGLLNYFYTWSNFFF